MRAIWLVRLDKVRPAVILTRQRALSFLTRVTVGPFTSTERHGRFEAPVGRRNGIDVDSVINFDNVTTVGKRQLIRKVGMLDEVGEQALVEALAFVFDLNV